jgi:hypothetical protein
VSNDNRIFEEAFLGASRRTVYFIVIVINQVTHDSLIELPRKIQFECPEIVEKSWRLMRAIALPDLNSISRSEFELPTTPTKMCSEREEILRFSPAAKSGPSAQKSAGRKAAVCCVR